MKVWFHTTMEQFVEEGEAYDYDTFTCSKLFSSIEVCVKDSERQRLEEFEFHHKRYIDSLERHKKKLLALDILKAYDIDPNELYWNVAEDPPEMASPSTYHVYAIDVEE